MKKNPGYFISIGGGENQLPLIRTAIARHAHVITVDKNDMAPGFSLSQVKILESTHEYRKVLNGLSQVPLTEKILGIGCRSFGKACYTANYLAEKLNLPGSPPESIRFLLDKNNYLSDFQTLGIHVPKIIPWNQPEDLFRDSSKLPYPLVLKPVRGNSKLGIEFFSHSSDLKSFLNSHSPTSEKWILQEYIEGDEVTVLGMVDKNHDFQLISMSDKITTDYPPFLEIAHILPSQHMRFLGEIIRILNFLSKYLSLAYSPLVAEFRITSEGKIYLMELAPEVGGEYLADYLIPEFFGVDYFDLLFNLLIGETFQLPKEILNGRPMNKKESAILFKVPTHESNNVTKSHELQLGVMENIFLSKELLGEGSKVNLSMGNHSRSSCIGITRQILPANPSRKDWIASILQRWGKGFV